MILSYNNQPITQREIDGYVNAIEMCQANGKLVADWMRTKETKAYIDAIAGVTGISVENLVIVRKGLSSDYTQGTWIHPKLVTKLARWLSLEFEIWCDTNLILNSSFSPHLKDPSGFIYLVEAKSSGHYKIGISKNPYRRMTSLQTGSPFEMVMVHRIYSFNCVALEKILHEYYSAYWLRGEWFDLPQECVKEFPMIAYKLNAALECPALPADI